MSGVREDPKRDLREDYKRKVSWKTQQRGPGMKGSSRVTNAK